MPARKRSESDSEIFRLWRDDGMSPQDVWLELSKQGIRVSQATVRTRILEQKLAAAEARIRELETKGESGFAPTSNTTAPKAAKPNKEKGDKATKPKSKVKKKGGSPTPAPCEAPDPRFQGVDVPVREGTRALPSRASESDAKPVSKGFGLVSEPTHPSPATTLPQHDVKPVSKGFGLVSEPTHPSSSSSTQIQKGEPGSYADNAKASEESGSIPNQDEWVKWIQSSIASGASEKSILDAAISSGLPNDQAKRLLELSTAKQVKKG